MTDTYSGDSGAGAAAAEPAISGGALETGSTSSPLAEPASSSTDAYEPTNGSPSTEQFQRTEPTYLDPPKSWKREIAERHWPRLDHEIRSYLHQRESEAHRAITNYGAQAKSFEPFERVTAEFGEHFKQRGLEPASAFRLLVQAQERLDADPKGTLAALMQGYGLTAADFLPRGYQAGDTQGHQQHAQAQQQIAALQAELNQARSAVQEHINEFGKSKPHFQQVFPLMASLMEGGHAKTLDAAYEMAVNASPIGAQLQAEKRKTAESKRLAEAQQRADAARRAARVNVRSSTTVAHAPSSMNDTIDSLATKIYGR
jgi:hypothetical protein